MNIEFLPEKLFFKEVAERRHLWLARQDQGVLAFNNQDGGLSLLVWSDRKKIEAYLKSTKNNNNLQLIEFPIQNFEISFLSKSEITEFQLNPTSSGLGVLVLNKEEFKENFEKIKSAT